MVIDKYIIQFWVKDKLLIYNVKQGWSPLCKFLNLKEPDLPFPFINDKNTFSLIFNNPTKENKYSDFSKKLVDINLMNFTDQDGQWLNNWLLGPSTPAGDPYIICFRRDPSIYNHPYFHLF